MKIREVWHPSEITDRSRKLFAKIGIDYLRERS
jgi:hypothetical protein